MIGKHIFVKEDHIFCIWKINNIIYNLPWSNKTLTLLNKKKAHPSIFQNYFKGSKKKNKIVFKDLGIYLYKWWKGGLIRWVKLISHRKTTRFLCVFDLLHLYIVYIFKGDKSVHQQTEATQFFFYFYLIKKKYINTV